MQSETGKVPGNPGEALSRADLPPIYLDAWLHTRRQFAAAIGAGPGHVALVGPEGSGKTYTLRAVALASKPGRVFVRTVGQTLPKGILIDFVDAVDQAALQVQAAEPAFVGCHVYAVRPELVDRLRGLFPAARSLLERLCDGNPGRLDQLREIGAKGLRPAPAAAAAWYRKAAALGDGEAARRLRHLIEQADR